MPCFRKERGIFLRRVFFMPDTKKISRVLHLSRAGDFFSSRTFPVISDIVFNSAGQVPTHTTRFIIHKKTPSVKRPRRLKKDSHAVF